MIKQELVGGAFSEVKEAISSDSSERRSKAVRLTDRDAGQTIKFLVGISRKN